MIVIIIYDGAMRRNLHPTYRQVAFRDCSADLVSVTGSTLDSSETITLDDTTYPVVDVEISSASHPFWTGRGRVMDTEGRVERFRRRYGVGA